MGDVSGRTDHRCFVLGVGAGWHAEQLLDAAGRLGIDVRFANYESLRMRIGMRDSASRRSNRNDTAVTVDSDPRPVPASRKDDHRGLVASEVLPGDHVLVRTMPPGSLEQTTFRLACLHQWVRAGNRVVNPPSGLELAIDKNATLAIAASLGIAVPATLSTVSRAEALDAFDAWGGDCVVKPLFGGEGKGVMRLQNRELARTVFSTLQTLGSVIHLQQFIPPGGSDRRLLIVGDHADAIRRTNLRDFRTNRRFAVDGSHHIEAIDVDERLLADSRKVCDAMGLAIAAVDWIDDGEHGVRLIEVNAIPGWYAAQTVIADSIAERILDTVMLGVAS